MNHKNNSNYIEKLTVTFNQENRKKEITIGSLIQMSICLDTENKEYQMELPRLLNLRDMVMISLKLSLLKKQQKILKVYHLIFQDNQETQAKAKIQDQIMCTVLKMFKETIHGMQLDVSTVNHQHKKFNLIKILVNQSNQIVEML